MKRILLIILIVLTTTGCMIVENASIDSLIESAVKNKYEIVNKYNGGFKYYLPRELRSVSTDEFNEIIKSKNNDYYLYVDLVAYHNKKTPLIEEDPNIFYSKEFNKGDKVGILNIKEVEDNYFVNIYFNYSSIEVKCKKSELNNCVSNSLVMITTVKYNDDVIDNLINSNEFSSYEEKIDVFKKNTDTGDVIDVDEEDVYSGNEEDDYDPDVIIKRG